MKVNVGVIISGARFIDYERVGRLWVDHDQEVRAEFADWILAKRGSPAQARLGSNS